MTLQEHIFSHAAIFSLFMMSLWPWILLESNISWSSILRISSRQCHINPVFVPPRKPPYQVMDIYDYHTSVG